MFRFSLHKQKPATGYTLIEAIVYIAILTVILVAVMLLVVVMLRSLSGIRANHTLMQGAEAGLERLLREVRKTGSINLTASVFDTSPGRLVLISTDSGNNQITQDFYVDNGRLLLSTNGATGLDLLPQSADLDSLIFRQFDNVGVKIEMTISDSRTDAGRAFYSSAVLR
ncbi:MAG: hypothetical protein WDZ85_00080 [Candidatus Paceibacterota bacterium]